MTQKRTVAALASPGLIAVAALLAAQAALATNVIVTTPLGEFEIELFDDEAANTVSNFLNYVDDGDYANSFIHRSVADFVIQGGGYVYNNGSAAQVLRDDPIANEFGRSNLRGTVAMAKPSGSPDGATSQWFVNLDDNSGDLDDLNGGFTVFGRVVGNGMEVVDAIAELQVWNAGGPFAEIPLIDFSAGDTITEANLVFTQVARAPGSEKPFVINPGMSGAWFNPATPGQGWLIDVIVRDEGLELFVAWFTFAVAADDMADNAFGSTQHRWFTASGPVEGDSAGLTLYNSTGGVFNDDAPTDLSIVGTLDVQFSGCTNATFAFDFDDPSVADAVLPAVRLSEDVFCAELAR